VVTLLWTAVRVTALPVRRRLVAQLSAAAHLSVFVVALDTMYMAIALCGAVRSCRPVPIIRTYACPECLHQMDVVLTAEQWDDPPPDCPACDRRDMQQEFKPPAIGGSARSRATAIAEQIASEDYKVANFHAYGKEGHPAKVRYKDQSDQVREGKWAGPNAREYQIGQEALESAVALGRASRLKYGSGLDVLQQTLADGTQPDLIEQSKRRSARIW
jgi:hypothetical protein